jgi:hypothetical protein
MPMGIEERAVKNRRGSVRRNLGGGRVDQIAMRIERAQQSNLIGPHIGLNSFQGFFIHEK